jgi:outer membrane murein-binding lipoprotein Lpp
MKRLRATFLVLFSLALSGCGDKEAREYAAKLIPVLNTYQEQLAQKIKAEQDSYEELAANYEEVRKDEIIIRLASERNSRSAELGEEIASATKPPSVSKILDAVQKYADNDFKATQGILEEGLDARSKYLTDLESLEVELQKIKLLKESLTELTKSKKDFKQFKEATDFLIATDVEINKLLCVDLRKGKDDLTRQKAAATDAAEKEKIAQAIKRLEERITSKNCP